MSLSPPKSRALQTSTSTDRTSTTLANSSLDPSLSPQKSALAVPPDSSSRRVVSTPLSHRSHDRSRRTAAGGFLLDNGSTRSSLDRPRASLDRQRDHGIRPATSFSTAGRSIDQFRDVAPEPASSATDPAAVVSMILSGAARRRGEGTAYKRQSLGTDRKGYGPSLRAPGSPTRGGADSMGFGNHAPPPRPFLISGRPPSSGSTPKTPIPPLSPPPAPTKSSFSPIQQPKQFRELQFDSHQPDFEYDARFTQATIQRTEKAKKFMQLSEYYRELMNIWDGHPDAKHSGYNPLQAIRDRRIRARKKVQLDASQWDNLDSVRMWVEDVGVAVHSPEGPEGPDPLPPPPPGDGTGRILKRPKLEWQVGPEELFADFYWNAKNEEDEREMRQPKKKAAKSLDAKENERTPFWPENNTEEYPHGLTHQPDPTSSSTLRTQQNHYDSTASTDIESTDSEDYSDNSESGRKHHRRRRKLGKIISGSRRRERKKEKQKEKDKEGTPKREVEEIEWAASKPDESANVTIPPLAQQEADADETFDSLTLEDALNGQDPEDDQSGAFGPGKSILDQFSGDADLCITGDTEKLVVPSIAISLSPPSKTKLSGDSEPRGDDKRAAHPKKLLSKGKDAFHFREKEVDDGRESLDQIRPKKSFDLKDKGQKHLVKVKTRVDKLRSEVSKVEDFIPWKRDTSSAAPSPTGSSFTFSEDEMEAPFMRRDGTASASELDDDRNPRSGRQSLEVPRPSNVRRPSKHRSHFSTSQIPSLKKRVSLGSDRDVSPKRLDAKLSHLPREPSPIRNVHIESLQEHERNTIILSHPPKPRFPPASPSFVSTEPSKQQQPQQQQQHQQQRESSQQTLYRRDPDGTKLAWLRAGIVARGISQTLPTRPSLHPSCTSVRADLTTLATSNQRFIRTSAPQLLDTVSDINDEINGLIPQLRDIADECHKLESLATMEINRSIGSTREDLRRLRRRGRWKIRRLLRMASSTLGWWVTIMLWCVWAVYTVINLVLLVLVGPIVLVTRVGWRIVRALGKWLLWLE